MKLPSRLVLALLAILLLGWRLGTVERWSAALAPHPATAALLTNSVKPIPALDTLHPAPDTAALADPFGTVALPVPSTAPAKPTAAASRPAAAPGPRPWKLVGLVGTRSAILAKGDRTFVVGAGERIESIRVVSISVQGVTLEDEAGQWGLSTVR